MSDYTERIDDMEEKIIEALGLEEAFLAVTKAMSYKEKDDIYGYILRCYGLYSEEE